MIPLLEDEDGAPYPAEVQAAFAAVIASWSAARAEAWDEGYEARRDEDVNVGGTLNPYREMTKP